jgi:hypothetical protein
VRNKANFSEVWLKKEIARAFLHFANEVNLFIFLNQDFIRIFIPIMTYFNKNKFQLTLQNYTVSTDIFQGHPSTLVFGNE